MHKPLFLITAGGVAAGALIIATALPAAAATSGRAESAAPAVACTPPDGGGCADTPVTFSVTSTGVLGITAPTATVDLGSGVAGNVGSTIGSAGNFGLVTVTDNRGLNPASWTATVSSTAFANSVTPADVIPVDDATYLTGAVTPTVASPANSTATSVNGTTAITLSAAAQSVVTEAGFDGDNAAEWTPEILITIPAGAVVGDYDGTVTHSVS
jgi:hypothetical protein